MISVVIPLYNKENTVARALRSVLGQAYQDFEVVVVNDGSTDESVAEVERVKDQRIRLIHQKNAGVSAARNRGIQESMTETVAFLDADDEWKPWFADTVTGLQREFPQAGVWATSYEFALPNGTRQPARLRGLPSDPWRGLMPDYFLTAACSHPPINSSSVSVSRKAINSINGFPVGVRSGEDLLTWARLASQFPIAYCSEPSSTFWVTTNTTSLFSPPSRRPELPDVVGQELEKLENLLDERRARSLRLYVARWSRMRASMFARSGNMRHTLGKSFHALRLNPREPMVLGFLGLAMLHWIRKLLLTTGKQRRS